jgi:acyl-CoA synthetase (AMP-forming)/AMP-acid ligase II
MTARRVVDDDSILTIPALIRDRARQVADELHIVGPNADGSTARLTFGEVDRLSRDVAKALLQHGVQHGDRVAVWAPNIWEWITVSYGIQTAGAALVPINTRYKGREALYLLRKSGARILFTVSDFLDTDYVGMLRTAMADDPYPGLEQIVVMRGPVPDATRSLDDFVASGATVGDDIVDQRIAQIGAADRSDISFTSGTTGDPKGVVASHGQTSQPFRAWVDVVGLRSSDRVIVIAPFFHSFGSKAGFFTALLAGATVYPQLTFDPEATLQLISNESITVIPGPPAIFQTLLSHPDRQHYDLTSLRLAVTGSANVPVELVIAMRDTLGFEQVVTGYGLTEASGIATMCRYDDDPETVARTAGRAVPGVELKIVDRDENELPTGTPGEVLIRGYNVMEGYWEEPDRTAETIVDGWLRTGDIGVLDERGNLRITDRVKDMYIVGGFNAYPVEIENALVRHPDIVDAAVIGVPHDRLGETGMAWVVRRPGSSLSEKELIAWTRDELANFKVPSYVEFVDELPKNASAKVVKPQLRERSADILRRRSD